MYTHAPCPLLLGSYKERVRAGEDVERLIKHQGGLP